jgi:hypothetical protein
MQTQLDKQNGTNVFNDAIKHFIENAGIGLDEDCKDKWRSMTICCLKLYDERNQGSHSYLVQDRPTPESIGKIGELISLLPHRKELGKTERKTFVWALEEYRRRTSWLTGGSWMPHHILRGMSGCK